MRVGSTIFGARNYANKDSAPAAAATNGPSGDKPTNTQPSVSSNQTEPSTSTNEEPANSLEKLKIR